MARSDAARLLDDLRQRGATLATAESLTGGRLAARVTAVPGASDCFLGGVVSYATEVKVEVLGVPTAVVERDGVVSAACARAMADGVRRLTGASYAVSTTGVAGPGPSEGVPAGTVYVGVAGPRGTTAVGLELVGDREAVQERACDEALAALMSVVTSTLGEELHEEQGGLG
ncbi:CinA family protein [Nocardioides taihuensis]|uniref:CinA family protein n=1 Tax=Nocardioides taihuensis TaxID=1835606 RepID=A0ABW0BQA4_9ACTN